MTRNGTLQAAWPWLRRAVTAALLAFVAYSSFDRYYPAPLCWLGVHSACTDASLRALQSDPPDGAAFALAERGCSGGNAMSCNNLGVCFQRGTGTRADLAQARKYYAHACNLGNGLGCYNQAEFSFVGKGGPSDVREAERLLELGCRLRDPRSCHWLIGLKPGDRALDYARQGCELEHVGSCNTLTMLLAVHEPKSAELRERVGDLNTRCANDQAHSCAVLAMLFSTGVGVERNEQRARELVQRSCVLGHELACKIAQQPAALPNTPEALRPLVDAMVAAIARSPRAE